MLRAVRLNRKSLALAVLLVALGSPAVGANRDPLERGLIHWWKFDGNANDYAGDLNAEPIGPVTYTNAVLGQGIVFDGPDTGISLPPAEDLQFKASYSISAWVSLNAYPERSRLWATIIFDGDDRPGLDPYHLRVGPGGHLQFLATGPTRALVVEDPKLFPLHVFALVSATFDRAAGVQTLYVNGRPVGRNTDAFDLTPVCPLAKTAWPGVGIGNNNAFPNSRYNMGWNGVIEDLRVYDRAISPREVHALYRQRLAKHPQNAAPKAASDG